MSKPSQAKYRTTNWTWCNAVAHFSHRALDGSYRLLIKDLSESFPERLTPSVVPAGPKGEIRSALQAVAQRHGLDYALLHAVAQAESGFNPMAVSPKGAIGVMQLMPATAQRYGVQAADAAALRSKLHQLSINIDAGGRYLSDLIRQFNGQTELALAAYNAGEGAVRRAGNQIPNYPETRNYVEKVMKTFHKLRAESGELASSRETRYTPAEAPLRVSGKPTGAVMQDVQLFRGEMVEFKKFEQGFEASAR